MTAHLRLSALFITLIIAALGGSCKKGGNTRWIYYDETQCSDRWTFDTNNERLKQNVTSYMDGKGVKIYEMEIFRVAEQSSSCTQCYCKTGRQYKCKIKKGDVSAAKSEGFYE